jgi:hypothetical protein
MEPDLDRILSKKIREAEQRPVSWNKQDVWRNVLSQTGTRPHYRYLYYVAAAMVPLLIYFAVLPTKVEITPTVADKLVSDEKGKSRVTPTEPENTVVEKKQDHISEPAARATDSTPMIAITDTRPMSPDTTQRVQAEKQTTDVIPEPVTNNQISEDAYLLVDAVTVPEQKIKPIVGIITESYSEDIANVKRNKRLRKLKPSEETPWEDPKNALVFAMRK